MVICCNFSITSGNIFNILYIEKYSFTFLFIHPGPSCEHCDKLKFLFLWLFFTGPSCEDCDEVHVAG